ncbi:MAG: hydroxyacid dehydrogenase, partial [Clostridia bacterium]|nr:hydroxyacid dehydrogenase [Clostridia bacterium]
DIDAGVTACVYTRRKVLLLENDTKEAALLRSVAISDAVQSFAANLKTKPAFIIAKGGITSSDVGVKALRAKKALVLGQAAAGIPVWRTGPESKFPGLSYIIFPGNVGSETTLREIAEELI